MTRTTCGPRVFDSSYERLLMCCLLCTKSPLSNLLIIALTKKKYPLGRGLKLKLLKVPHSTEKILRGPLFIRKTLLRAAVYKKSPQNKPNLIKLFTLVIFEVFAGRVFETPALRLNHRRSQINKNMIQSR